MRLNECYLEIPCFSQSLGFQIKIIETVADFTHREYFEHKHSDFEIAYVVSGNGIYNLEDRIYEFEKDDIFIFGTNVVHCITDTLSPEYPKFVVIQFEPRMIWSPFSNLLTGEYRRLFNGKKEKLDRNSPMYSQITSTILKIFDESVKKNAGYQVMIRAYLCEIIGLLIRVNEGAVENYSNESYRDSLVSVDRAMTYINQNLDKRITLQEIAEVAGFSRTYFSSLFTQLNGLSPWEYITIRRVERSKDLLKNTSDAVITISEKCGFSNLSNFNRIFSRITGTSPSKYRKLHRIET